MARQPKQTVHKVPMKPLYPTTVRSRLSGGRVVGTDNSLWCYRAVPMAPVVDAASPAEGLSAADPLIALCEQLAAETRVRTPANRRMNRGGYRELHILLVNIPASFVPPRDHPLAGYLHESFASAQTYRRVLLVGVRLRAKVAEAGLWSKAGFGQAIDSVAQTIRYGGAPLSDFDEDYLAIDRAMTAAGMRVPSPEDLALANSWWNGGRSPEAPLLVHADHLHVFGAVSAARAAARLMADGDTDCLTWPDLPRHHTLALGCLYELDLRYVPAESPLAQWAPVLLAEGAAAISIRAKVEPPKVTREELRRRRKQYRDDINERASQGKMERAEQEELYADLDAVESIYATAGPPTLVDCGVLAAFTGHDERFGHTLDHVGRTSGLSMVNMVARQEAALAECWLASPIRATPHLHDFPVQTVAASGLPSLSVVGDKSGALVGFTERDRQPAWLSPVAASRADGLPLMVVPGATGSGKAFRLSTAVATPTGWTTMGKLRVGDQVLGRDGRPCNVVFVSEINQTPDLYAVHFDDGQIVYADSDHQWIVSPFYKRNYVRRPKRLRAIENWKRRQDVIARIADLADLYGPDDVLRASEIYRVGRKHIGDDFPFYGQVPVRAALDFVGCPSNRQQRRIDHAFAASTIKKADPVVLFPVVGLLQANLSTWKNVTGGNLSRWGKRIETKIAAAERVIAETDLTEETTVAEIARRLIASGAEMPHASKNILAEVARRSGIPGRNGHAVVTAPRKQHYVRTRTFTVYPAQLAFKALAERARQRFGVRPNDDAEELVMTTGEMLAEGIRLNGGNARFAVRIALPLEFPNSDLPLDPYVLGAWLGDGGAWQLGITSADPEIIEECVKAGFPIKRIYNSSHQGEAQTYFLEGLLPAIRLAGFDVRPSRGISADKHIPMPYLRSSFAQRLSLLQGLMDTDGTIDKDGCCELSLCNRQLAYDALELIRSLGVKVSITESDAVITEDDPDQPGEKRRRVTGRRWQMHFTTATPVFRLSRKLARVNARVRETQKWLYITAIEKVRSEPARCIQVDSPDSSYLCAGFVPTHNSAGAMFLADQFARLPNGLGELTPVVIVDPKTGSDFSAAVQLSGGRVASLDDLLSADGVYDPMRFSITLDTGVELAASMLMSINPWGTAAFDFETPLVKALSYGARAGADCIGVALQTALRDGQVRPQEREMVERVLDLAQSSPMFRACVGMEQGGPRLRVSQGITLIMVGSAHLDLPEPGALEPTLPQRIALALVRMMVFGSAMALNKRRGVIMLDEGWVFLSAGKTEVERLGRLARSQQVLPIFLTQRVTDALNAGLAGYISRGLILPIRDEQEAIAACELFKLKPTPERIGRITANATVGATTAGEEGAPNWGSMRALRDPVSRKTLRGTIGIYCDLESRAVPVEIKIPEAFLAAASTNPEDIERREREAAALRGGERTDPATPERALAMAPASAPEAAMPPNPSWD